MSQFTTPADLRMLDEELWAVLTPFRFYIGEESDNDWIIVPYGFITDLASIPRAFWSILPPFGEYAKAAILHDFLYCFGNKGRKYADRVLLEAMTVLGVAKWRRFVIYSAVRIFGGSSYKGT